MEHDIIPIRLFLSSKYLNHYSSPTRMPINIDDDLPAKQQLEDENITVMTPTRAEHQDIRPLEIAILNLMPDKPKTERQLLRRLSNTPLQLNISLVHPKTHQPKTTPSHHTSQFYTTPDRILENKYDGLIITGAPVEHLNFRDVDYWDELASLMDWTRHNVTSTLHICWGAQAGLYRHHGIPKRALDQKTFGIFRHQTYDQHHPLTRGFDDEFWAPHSRHTTIDEEDIKETEGLELLAASEEAGAYLIATRDGKEVYVTGHSEYDKDTLKEEWERDTKKGLSIEKPANYFPNDDPTKEPVVRWRGHSELLYRNWTDHIYQTTPYRLDDIE